MIVVLALGTLSLPVITWATSVVEGRKEGRKEGRNNRKECHSTSRARKVRLKIKASYCNILKVSQVLTFQFWVITPSLFINEWKEPPG